MTHTVNHQCLWGHSAHALSLPFLKGSHLYRGGPLCWTTVQWSSREAMEAPPHPGRLNTVIDHPQSTRLRLQRLPLVNLSSCFAISHLPSSCMDTGATQPVHRPFRVFERDWSGAWHVPQEGRRNQSAYSGLSGEIRFHLFDARHLAAAQPQELRIWLD